MSGEAPAAEAQAQAAAATAPAGKRKAIVPIAVLLVVAIGATGYWLYSRGYEDTDDAQIDGDISSVSPRVVGTVKSVLVADNQVVKAGDLLAELETSDLEVALAQVKARQAEAEAQLHAEDPTVGITQASTEAASATAGSDLASSQAAVSAARKDVDQLTAQLEQAEANNRTAQLEKQRSDQLIAQGAIAQSESDARSNTAAAAQASVMALRQAHAAAQDRVAQQSARLGASQSRLSEARTNAPLQVETKKASVLARQASVDLAKAQVAQAELNLSYAKITAPIGGIVGRKSMHVGDRVAPGQQLLALAQTDGLWVTANFRETQLRHLAPGQHVKMSVDSLGLDLDGTIESLGGATGSRFSVLPPENATGNYVKVVQRVPVRIKLAPGQAGLDRLRIGMSVEPDVSIR